VSSHHLDTARLMRDVDLVRRAGAPDEIPYRKIAAEIGVRSSLFTRLSRGERPDADSLCSLLMWLDPNAPLTQYVLPGSRRVTRADASIAPGTS
jgi:hypothetical protein